MKARCLKCRFEIEIKDEVISKTKNNLNIAKGLCPICGTRVCRILPKDSEVKQ
jgi:hypothetical protein